MKFKSIFLLAAISMSLACSSNQNENNTDQSAGDTTMTNTAPSDSIGRTDTIPDTTGSIQNNGRSNTSDSSQKTTQPVSTP